jgi:hypothetical protein
MPSGRRARATEAIRIIGAALGARHVRGLDVAGGRGVVVQAERDP